VSLWNGEATVNSERSACLCVCVSVHVHVCECEYVYMHVGGEKQGKRRGVYVIVIP